MHRIMSRWMGIGLSMVCAISAAQTIPPVHAEALAGNRVVLPDDLHTRTAVLVLGFSKGSQDEVTAWGKRLAADYRDSTSIVYYEMAMLASVPRPIRGFVIRSMKKSVPDRAQARFLPLTSDEDAWRTLIHYQGGDAASVLVVGPTGHVLWQTQGPVTEPVMQELKHHLP
jgi:hypothetical protein